MANRAECPCGLQWPCHLLGVSFEGQHTPTKETDFFNSNSQRAILEHKSACSCMWARPRSGTPGLCRLERQGALSVDWEPAARGGRGRHSAARQRLLQYGNSRCYGSGARNARQLQGWVSRASTVAAGMGKFAEHVPCFASLILWVLILESL